MQAGQRMRIVPFEDKYLGRAAELLAARQRQHRRYVRELPQQFEDKDFDASFLRAKLSDAGMESVVALVDDRVVGFLLGKAKLIPPGSGTGFSWRPRSATMPGDGHAVDPQYGDAAYRAMYAALAPRWLAAGLYSHYINVPAYDRCALDTWFALTFGLTWTYAVRETRPLLNNAPPEVESEIEIGLAEPQERDAVLSLLDGLYQYHARPPCYLPFLPDTAAGFRSDNEKAWADSTIMHWVARSDARAIGVFVVKLPTLNATDLFIGRPERCLFIHLAYTVETARGTGVGARLVDRVLAWAREQGFACCSVEWHTANLSAASFWERCQFRPVRHMLFRQVDERVAASHSH